jgi:hypothetical protein
VPTMLLHIPQHHLEYIRSRFEFESPLAVLRKPDGQEETLDAYMDSSHEFDRFVRRCIGTMDELEELQRSGGVVLVGYPDGSYREITIDATHDGQTLPRVGGATTRGNPRATQRWKRANH